MGLDENKVSAAKLKLVEASDMDEETSNELTQFLEEAISNHANSELKEKMIASELRNKADENFGNVWHCIIGKCMAVAIRHQEKRFAHWTFNFDWHVYLWKTL